MITRCGGGWTEDAHAPVLLTEKYPLSNPAITDICCDRCARALRVPIVCRLCGNVESTTGLCDRCDLKLTEDFGAPSFRLTIYRLDGAPLSGYYNGADVAAAVRAAWKVPSFCAFALLASTRPA